MDSSRGACEILESKEELNSLHSSEGKAVRKSCVYAAEDDLNQLIKAIDLKISSKPVSPSQQMCADIVRRNTSKKPLKAPEFGISESVTLKQALRRLCISQASEIAATKRSPKPIGLSGISESGTIDKLYASVVVQTNDPSLSLDEGRRNLVEISFLPEIVNAGSSEKNIKLRQMCNLDSSHKTITYPSCAVRNSVGSQKTSIKDVIASADVEDDASDATNMGTKGKAISKLSLSSSRIFAESVKSSSSPRLINPIFNNKTFLKKKGKQKPVTMPGTSSLCAQHNGVGSVPTPASSCTNQNDEVVMRNKDSNEAKVDFTPDKRNDIRGIGGKMSGSARSKEKGECSQSSKSSIGDYSSSTSISEESHQSGSGGNWCRPHMSRDVRWIAIRQIMLQCGSLGLKNFKLLKKLGCGDIGTVYLAELIGSECLFALKVMDIEYLVSRKKMLRAQTERDILQMLDHPFLPTLYTHFTTDNLSCLVMEYCPGGDLHVLRQKQPGRSFYELAARFYVAEVLLALEYLHMLGVVYRDLKPENILVREDGHIMLSDFDLSLRCTVNPSLLRSSSIGTQEPSKKLSGPCTENSCIDPLCLQPSWVSVSCFTPRLVPSTVAKARKLKSDTAGQVSPLPQLVVEPVDARSNSFVGTHEYLAPEIIRGDGHGSAVDWWTFGIFLYELLFGRTPFKGLGNDETLANVVSQLLVFPESPTVSFHAKDLIRGLLVKEPENRLGSVRGAAEIKQHPFFEGLNWALIRCAAPPETPRSYDIGTPVGMRKKKEGRCLDFRTGGEDVEYEVF